MGGAAEDGSFFVLGKYSFLGSGVLVSCRLSLISSGELYPGPDRLRRSSSIVAVLRSESLSEVRVGLLIF